jgi:energy-converting hydrogenase A subunit R
VKTPRRVFITDCEGPVSKNDNAFELTSHFVPDGETLFTQISRYDDILADIVRRKGYQAGDTLKLILPFLKAYDVTDEKIVSFSAKNILLMPGAKETLQSVRAVMPAFIVSTSYEHYLRALCPTLGFPYEDTYCTRLSLDVYRISSKEKKQLKRLDQEICAMQLLEIPEKAVSLQMLSEKSQQTFRRFDEIFWEEITQLESGTIIEEVNPVGGLEKAEAARKIAAENGCDLDSVMYVGDSITDVECFRLLRETGGLTVSFNGNGYAVREADIAVLSPNAIVIAVLADVFNRLGHDAIYRLTDDWSYAAMEKHGVDPSLRWKMQSLFKKDLPKLNEITADNADAVAAESSAFRKLVRGEKVGSLG